MLLHLCSARDRQLHLQVGQGCGARPHVFASVLFVCCGSQGNRRWWPQARGDSVAQPHAWVRVILLAFYVRPIILIHARKHTQTPTHKLCHAWAALCACLCCSACTPTTRAHLGVKVRPLQPLTALHQLHQQLVLLRHQPVLRVALGVCGACRGSAQCDQNRCTMRSDSSQNTAQATCPAHGEEQCAGAPYPDCAVHKLGLCRAFCQVKSVEL